MEIERKFLPDLNSLPFRPEDFPFRKIEQGYLCTSPVVRIRRDNEQFFLTYKSKGLMVREEYNLPLTEEAYETIKSYNTQEWEIKAQNFNDAVGRLIEEYEKSREMEMIPVTIEGKEFKLSPGKHNEVQAAVINEFAPRFAAGAKVLYIGDTANKDLYCNKELLKEIGIPITEHSKLPDIVIYDGNKEWLFLIEVVTSHGPVSPKRVIELEDFMKECKAGKVYVTAFPDRSEFKKHVADIAWETEVWIAENPDHMIHFNGDRFIGPR